MRLSRRPTLCLEELEGRDSPASLLPIVGSVTGSFSGLQFVFAGNISNLGTVTGAPTYIPLGFSQGVSFGTDTTAKGNLTRVSFFHVVPTPVFGLVNIVELLFITGGEGQLAGAFGAQVEVGTLNVFTGTGTIGEAGLLRTTG